MDDAEQIMRDENDQLRRENESLKQVITDLQKEIQRQKERTPKTSKGQKVRFNTDENKFVNESEDEEFLHREVQKLLQENFELKEEVKQLREVYEQERWK